VPLCNYPQKKWSTCLQPFKKTITSIRVNNLRGISTVPYCVSIQDPFAHSVANVLKKSQPLSFPSKQNVFGADSPDKSISRIIKKVLRHISKYKLTALR
jgi:hypothetical protein